MMKNKKFAGVLASSLCLALAVPFPALADASKVVTLGADLTEEQRTRMLNYFKVDPNTVRILTITNQDERNHLSSYVPLEQIGTFTVSSAYVNPTMSGGIKVRTANLNWVTSNRIAATLSTSGVVNCEVIAAAPFEVSGTGALTGVIMAYEAASGEKLDETKKDLAAQEMVVTGNLANEIGSMEATAVVNEAKMEVIGDNIQVAEDIQNVVNNIVEENNYYEISDERLDEIVHLLEEISKQDYNYEDMKETLERVEENVTKQDDMIEVDEPGSGSEDQEDDMEVADETEDGILDNLDESVLGDNVISSSTEEHEWENPDLNDVEEWDSLESFDDEEWDVFPGESGEEPSDSENWDEMEEIEELEEFGELDDIEDLDEAFDIINDLDSEQRELYDQAELFCKAGYQGSEDALAELKEQGLLEDAAEFYPSWSQEVGENLTAEVLQAYMNILLVDGQTYINDAEDPYEAEELNLLNKELNRIFGIDSQEYEGAMLQAGVSLEERTSFFEKTMKFFEKLYGEEGDSQEEDASSEEDTQETNDEGYGETYEDSLEEPVSDELDEMNTVSEE